MILETSDIHILWSFVLKQLKTELPPHWYSTWVAPTRPIASESSMFTVAAHTPYARDWLEDRLGAATGRMLTGLTARPMTVRFVVAERPDETIDDQQTVLEPQPQPPVWEEARAALLDVLLEPHKVITFPKYLLRWLPLVGAEILWLVIAFRQARFLATTTTTRQSHFSARGQAVYAWCGMSRASFWRKLSDPRLGWFMELQRAGQRSTCGKSESDRPFLNRYRIPVEAPLTPMDAASLRECLLQARIRDRPLAALKEVREIAQNNQLCAYPPPSPTPEQLALPPRILTVPEVVAECLTGVHLNETDRAQSEDLIESLSNCILRPTEVVRLSWYFLRKWLGALGPNAGMFVVLLRSQAYLNRKDQEVREEVWMEGGAEEIARQLGISNPRLLYKWLSPVTQHGRGGQKSPKYDHHPNVKRSNLRAQIEQFVQRTDFICSSGGGYSSQYRVRMRDEPLDGQDQAGYELFVRLLEESRAAGVLSELFAWLESDHLEKDVARGIAGLGWTPDLRLSMPQESDFETLSRVLSSCFETHRSAWPPDLRLLLKYLKISTSLKTVLLETTTSQNCCLQFPAAGWWDLRELLRNNRVDASIQSRLLKGEHSPIPFVSWLIYAATQPRVINPVALTVKQLLSNPGVGAGAAYERLAEVKPQEFSDILWNVRVQGWTGGHPDAKVFQSTPSERIQLLEELLGILEDEDE